MNFNEDPQGPFTDPPPSPPAKSPAPISQLAAALAKAQLITPTPTKNRVVDFTDKNGRRVKYRYADLAGVLDCIRKPFGDNGLSIVHKLGYAERSYGLVTSLLHSSGENISTWYPLPDPLLAKPQDFGSAITYARRYSLSALVGIASEEDDDGAEASPASPEQKPESQPRPRPLGPTPNPAPSAAGGPSSAQITRLWTIASQKGWSNEQVHGYISMLFGIDSTKSLTSAQYQELCNTIETLSYSRACVAFGTGRADGS